MSSHDRITADPRIHPNKPTIKGTTVLVADVLRTLGETGSFAAVCAAYPDLSEEDIRAALAYAASEIERHPPPPEIQRPYTLEDLRRHRDAIIRIAAEHNATNVRVFGSVARGDARPGSDVDLLVRFAVDASLLDQAGLIADLKALISPNIDVISENGLRDTLRETVLNEAVAL